MRLSPEMTVYYFFLFISTLIICIFTMASEASTTRDIYNASTEYPPNYIYASVDYVHTKDDYVLVPFVNSDGDLMIAFKHSWGDSWMYRELASNTFGGNVGPWDAIGAIATDNGSVCVGGVISELGTYANNVYLFTKFPANDWDDWDAEEICYVANKDYIGDMAINDTDIIMFVFKWGAGGTFYVYYETFDFQAYSLGHAVGAGHWWNSYGCVNLIAVQANMTGSFHIFWRGGDGKDRYRDFNLDISALQISGSTAYQVHDVMCLNNDMWVCAGGASAGHRYYWYQTTYGGAYTQIQVSTDSTTWSYGTALSVIGNSTSVRIISFNNAAGDLRGYTWSAAWNADQTTWQNSVVEADFSDPDYIRVVGGCKHTWPRDNDGRWWAMPTGGWSFLGWDEDGATDEYAIFRNGTIFWGDLTTDPPQITTASLSQGTVGTYYTFTLSASDGTLPYNWSSLTLPAWLSLGASNGTLYGMPPASGTYIVSVRLADSIPRYDEETWNLKVVPRPSEAEGEDWEITIPDFIGPLWWMFIAFCVFVALFDLVRKSTG